MHSVSNVSITNSKSKAVYITDSYPNITGGGFVSTGPNVQKRIRNANQLESNVVYDNQYKG
jgi:hypothetical protein